MQSKSEDIVERYIRARNLTEGTRSEYIETAHKWNTSNGVSPIQDLDKRTGRELLEWVHEHSIENGGKSPGRTTNKACAQLRAFCLVENISGIWHENALKPGDE